MTSIKDISFLNKKALIRVDFNVPFDGDTISDNLGCEILWCDSVGVTPPCSDSIEIVLTIQNQSCYGNDGSIQIFASGGSGVYSYSLDSALNFSLNTFTNSVIIDSLTLGTYNVVVKDDSSCTSFFGDVIISTTPQFLPKTPLHLSINSPASEKTVK